MNLLDLSARFLLIIPRKCLGSRQLSWPGAKRCRVGRRCLLLLLSLTWIPAITNAAPVVWSGYDFTFTKADPANPTLPANQDKILDQIIITRGATEGIYNIAQEASFRDASPIDTEWAFPANNPNKQISAANWQDLKFGAWRVAIDNQPPNTIGQNAVLHIISSDIYLDIRFLSWGRREGSFSYIRALPPTVQKFACGDIDRDNDVDSSDLLGFIGNWTGEGPGSGRKFEDGDCDVDGDIDSSDLLGFLENWTGNLNNPAAAPLSASHESLRLVGEASGTAMQTIPEPTSGGLIAAGWLAAIGLTRRRGLSNSN